MSNQSQEWLVVKFSFNAAAGVTLDQVNAGVPAIIAKYLPEEIFGKGIKIKKNNYFAKS